MGAFMLAYKDEKRDNRKKRKYRTVLIHGVLNDSLNIVYS
jgi:hypothetical protein